MGGPLCFVAWPVGLLFGVSSPRGCRSINQDDLAPSATSAPNLQLSAARIHLDPRVFRKSQVRTRMPLSAKSPHRHRRLDLPSRRTSTLSDAYAEGFAHAFWSDTSPHHPKRLAGLGNTSILIMHLSNCGQRLHCAFSSYQLYHPHPVFFF